MQLPVTIDAKESNIARIELTRWIISNAHQVMRFKVVVDDLALFAGIDASRHAQAFLELEP